MNRYRNAVVYKIYCIDPEIKDIYVGSTINFDKRAYQHTMCSKTSKLPLYKFIRNNGSMSNFKIEILEKLQNCNCKTDLLNREKYYYETLKANLNGQAPIAFYGMKKAYEEMKKNIIPVEKCMCGYSSHPDEFNQHLEMEHHINFCENEKRIEAEKLYADRQWIRDLEKEKEERPTQHDDIKLVYLIHISS